MNQDRPSGLSSLVACWLVVCAFCLAIHWLAFRAWFRADDFAWLSLAPNVHNWHDLLLALFQPRAQGTIRPWSERGFFMLGYELFGLNSLPYRAFIFANQFANLFLVIWIGRRLTGSLAAGVCASLFWTISSSSMEPLGWACVYNEVQVALFFLLAFFCFLRFIDTGQRRYLVFEWIVFLLGFGSLEVNVVFPALAAGYALLCARKHLFRTLPMFAVSAAYAVFHGIEAPTPKTGEYALHIGGSMLRTLGTYWTWTVGPTYLSTPLDVPKWVVAAGVAVVTLAILWAAARDWRTAAPFFLLWFLVTLSPLLPLRDHVTEYYVFVPAIGVCWLGGWAAVRAWRAGMAARVAAVAVAVVYCLLQVPQLSVSTRWNYNLTVRAKNLVEGVAGAHELHPSQAILLYGVDADLFWNVIRGRAFNLIGVNEVYLSPDTSQHVEARPEWGSVDEFILPGEAAGKALRHGDLVVYDVRGAKLRNITSLYASLPRDDRLPLRVDVGNPLMADLLGPEWYKSDGGYRWMPKRATLRMGGPQGVNQKLHLVFYCSDEGLRPGAFDVTVSVDGIALPPFRVQPGNNSFEPEFALPGTLLGKPEVQIAIETSRTFRPASDPRDLGLAFGVVEIR